MKRLSKDQEKEKRERIEALTDAALEVRDAIAAANAVIETRLHAAIEAYNNAVTDAGAFRDEIVGEMESYAGERSEKWQEGDAGQAYESWKGEWEGFDTTELSDIDAIEEPDMEHGDSLEQLQHEPDR